MTEQEERNLIAGAALLEDERHQGRRLLADYLEGRRAWDELDAEEQRLAGGPALVDVVLAMSFRLRFEDPERMVELAKAACSLADRLRLDTIADPALVDLRARASAELGNAYRVADKLRQADQALSRARDLAAGGTRSLALSLRISELLAALRIDQRRFGEAEKLLIALGKTYRSQGRVEELATALIMLGRVRDQSYEPERAVCVYMQALEVMKPESPLRLAAVHGVAYNLIEAGLPDLGLDVLDSNRHLYLGAGKLVTIRLWWAEGKAARVLGDLDLAETKLFMARLAFLDEKQDFDAALVSLDLGLVLAQMERHKELALLSKQMLATFRALGIGREVLASVLLLKKACEESAPVDRLCGYLEILARVLPEVKRLRPRKRATKKK